MSSERGIALLKTQFSQAIATIHASTIRYPEWWTWLLSLYIWSWLIGSSLMYIGEETLSGRLIYCMTSGSNIDTQELAPLKSIVKELSLFSRAHQVLSNGFLPWVIMIVAMMFPLLNEAIRHMAFSVKRADRDLGILTFLVGYTISWCIAGFLFLLIPLFIDILLGVHPEWIDTALAAFVFLITAVVIWFPSRATTMARCAQTMPIRIERGYLHLDGIKYGAWMGIACIRMCWLPMTGLMLAHHSVYLMLLVTVVVIIERYFVPHTSKLPCYAFGIIALLMVTYGLYPYL